MPAHLLVPGHNPLRCTPRSPKGVGHGGFFLGDELLKRLVDGRVEGRGFVVGRHGALVRNRGEWLAQHEVCRTAVIPAGQICIDL